MKSLVPIVLIAGMTTTVVAATRVTITFVSQNDNRDFDAAASEYRDIWAAEGSRIIEGMEQISKLKFPEKNIKVEVYEGTSFSGRGSTPMRLRASYKPGVKKGTLVHELGPRMNSQLTKRPADLDEHRL